MVVCCTSLSGNRGILPNLKEKKENLVLIKTKKKNPVVIFFDFILNPLVF
jgi:hypothetical protein